MLSDVLTLFGPEPEPEPEPRPGRERRRAGPASAVAVAAGLVIAGVVVSQASEAAFTVSTENRGNTFGVASLELRDNDAGSALFTASNLTPGSSGTACLTVTYTGSVAPSAPVQLFVATSDAVDTPGAGGGGAAAFINWSVETADGSDILGSGGGCTGLPGSGVFGDPYATVVTPGGMLSDFVARSAYSSNGTTSVSSGWTPAAGSTSKVFRFRYQLATDVPNSAMGAGVTATITWEVRS